MEILYRLEVVLEKVQKKEGSWRQLVKNKKAPQPIYIGPRSPRWRESDLNEFLADPSAWVENYAKK